MRRGVAAALLLGTTAGCGVLCHDPDCPAPRPVQGEPQDFTAGPRAEGQVNVSGAERCPEPRDDAYGVVVTRTGSVVLAYLAGPGEVDAQTWLGELTLALRERGLTPHGYGFGGVSCRLGDSPASYLAIDDWEDANELVDEVASALERDDLTATIEIRIEPESIACSDTSCSW
jgi:hypothetical protein